jgi:hypothetical protein
LWMIYNECLWSDQYGERFEQFKTDIFWIMCRDGDLYGEKVYIFTFGLLFFRILKCIFYDYRRVDCLVDSLIHWTSTSCTVLLRTWVSHVIN